MSDENEVSSRGLPGRHQISIQFSDDPVLSNVTAEVIAPFVVSCEEVFRRRGGQLIPPGCSRD